MLLYTAMPRRASARTSWLSVTPEPERLLPGAVATLAAGAAPPPAAVERESGRVAELVRRARLRPWLAYLSRALALAEQRGDAADPAVIRARELTLGVITDHHHLLLGLPGVAARRTAAERARLRTRWRPPSPGTESR
jgi:hypothetical protein